MDYIQASPDTPKMIRETLCVAQTHVGLSGDPRATEHVSRLQRLIDICDLHRPLGSDGKHGDLHTATCGCPGPTPTVHDHSSTDPWSAGPGGPTAYIDGCAIPSLRERLGERRDR